MTNKTELKSKNQTLQRIILGSRFLQVPLYLGMVFALVLFSVKFYHELWGMMQHIGVDSESTLILGVLKLIDLLLVANLMIMVIISGYEGFIEPIIFTDDGQKPGWLGSLDPGTIKIKVATSIVGISSIHLLASFLAPSIDKEKIFWQVLIHLAFVLSACLLAIIDKMIINKQE